MNGTVLVAYATKYGATKETAEVIGQALRAAGREAEVLAAENVKDLSAYAAVILGSAVYVAQWRKEAATFLEIHEKALTERPVWLFSSGPTGSGDPVQLVSGWRFQIRRCRLPSGSTRGIGSHSMVFSIPGSSTCPRS